MKSLEQCVRILPIMIPAEQRVGTPSPYPTERTELVIGVEHDQYGHVNYKDFPGLFEPGQDSFMGSRGIGFDQIEKDYGLRSFVGGFEIKIKSQLHKGDQVYVDTTIEDVDRARITFTQKIIKNGVDAVFYKMHVFIVDQEGKLISVPDEIKERLAVRSPDP